MWPQETGLFWQVEAHCIWSWAYMYVKPQRTNFTPNVGLEPTTLRLRVSCSTDWANRAALVFPKHKFFEKDHCSLAVRYAGPFLHASNFTNVFTFNSHKICVRKVNLSTTSSTGQCWLCVVPWHIWERLVDIITAYTGYILKLMHIVDVHGPSRMSPKYKIHAQCGARTHDPEIKSLMLYRLS